MRIFFFVIAVATLTLFYYHDTVKQELRLGGSGNSSYTNPTKSITHGMASFGSSLGNSFESMGKGLSGN